ncbi:beta-D-galactosidase [Spirochaetia bacterium]|nr:beta-D-galactosidase [Spirochaetia bacterium]
MVCASYKDLIVPEKFMNPNWEKALAWLKGESWKDLPEGKFEIDGSKVYALRSSYKTKLPEEVQYESHRRYGDIQMLISGAEIILVCNRDTLKVTVPYSNEKDIDFLESVPAPASPVVQSAPPAPVHRVILGGTTAAIFFPEDAHKPCLAFSGPPAEVQKLVIKVAL